MPSDATILNKDFKFWNWFCSCFFQDSWRQWVHQRLPDREVLEGRQVVRNWGRNFRNQEVDHRQVPQCWVQGFQINAHIYAQDTTCCQIIQNFYPKRTIKSFKWAKTVWHKMLINNQGNCIWGTGRIWITDLQIKGDQNAEGKLIVPKCRVRRELGVRLVLFGSLAGRSTWLEELMNGLLIH